MAAFDEKILDGPNVGYCSSSEDEDNTPSSSMDIPVNDRPNTGPKGVIEDYKALQLEQRRKLLEKELAIRSEAERFTLENPVNQDFNENELELIKQKRLERMRKLTKGRIDEIKTKEDFLTVIEDSTNLAFIYLYEDFIDVQVLHDALLEIEAETRSAARFYRVKSNVLGTSKKFSSKALPTLQVYRKGELIGNFVQLFDILGEDFTTEELVKFLKKNKISID